jgi:hypothetical protein
MKLPRYVNGFVDRHGKAPRWVQKGGVAWRTLVA